MELSNVGAVDPETGQPVGRNGLLAVVTGLCP
jgi:hypothetical protein